MNKSLELKIKQAALYIIKNEATISDTANYFGCSASTIKKWINNEDKLKLIDKDLYNRVKEVQIKIKNIGNKKGGKEKIKDGTFKNSDFEILEVIETILSESLTLEEASIRFGIPTSTIYERVINYNDKEIVNELLNLFSENKKNATSGLNK